MWVVFASRELFMPKFVLFLLMPFCVSSETCFGLLGNRIMVIENAVVKVSLFWDVSIDLNSLSAIPTKWSNTLKQFVGNSRRIV